MILSLQPWRQNTRILLILLLLTSKTVLGSDATQAAEEIPSSLFQSLVWRNIGPFRGGRVVAVTGVVSNPKVFYFGGVGGVFKTVNGGESWFNVSDGYFKRSSVGAIAVAPSDPNVIYVGMGEHTIRGTTLSYGDGVYRSSDSGKTWRHLGLEATRVISRVLIHPVNPDLVYVACQGTPYVASNDRGVYRSKDGGETWQRVLFVDGTTGPADLAMDPHNPRILYTAMWDHQRKPWDLRSGGPGSAIYKSIDGGETWQKIVNGLPKVMGRIAIAVSADSERLYALVECELKGGFIGPRTGAAHGRSSMKLGTFGRGLGTTCGSPLILVIRTCYGSMMDHCSSQLMAGALSSRSIPLMVIITTFGSILGIPRR